jgi:hypothetical protein
LENEFKLKEFYIDANTEGFFPKQRISRPSNGEFIPKKGEPLPSF